MKWLKKNNYIVMLFAVCVILFVAFTSNSPKNITYQEIEVEHGDSLWSLSEQYHGKMSTEKWMDIVMVENKMNNVAITAGKPLVIPVTEDIEYFTGNTIEVAKDGQ